MYDLIDQQMDAMRRKFDLEKSRLVSFETDLERSAELLENYLQAQILLQDVIQSVQNEIHVKVSEVVNKCLAAVFDEPYELQIDFELKRGRTEAEIVLVRGDLIVDPLEATGGGVVDVVSFALRVASVILARPRVRPILFLDEPFKHVSKGYRHRCRSLVQALRDELGFQFIVVTHDPIFKMGKIVELGDVG